MAATGHMNPTLPLVAELVARGCKVSYFVEETMRAVVEAAGATWRPFRYPGSDFTGILRNPSDFEAIGEENLRAVGVPQSTPIASYGFPWCLVYNAQLVLPNLMDDLQVLDPPVSAIVYEPFLACARVAAHALGVPPISLFTMTGPGVLSMPPDIVESCEKQPWVQQPRRWIQESYGLDVLENGLMMEFYSPTQNLVTSFQELYMPPSSEHQIKRFGHFPFHCVGALVDPRVKRIENAGDGANAPSLSGEGTVNTLTLTPEFSSAALPLQQIREARNSDRRIVLISLGTVVTQRMWRRPLGLASRRNDERPEGSRSITEYTGKEFCQYVYEACFEAVRQDQNLLAIFAMGSNGEEALEGIAPPPCNAILRESVAQVELLPLCDAFVTHGGANSMHEALALALPQAIIPVFGDQIYNADALASSGAGISFRHPLKTLTAETLQSALHSLLQTHGPNTYKSAAGRLSKQLAAAGGVRKAADLVLEAMGAARLHENEEEGASATSLPTLLASVSGQACQVYEKSVQQ
eukprot:CAMPEP_0197628430 /NCGR_PEP_ID=MMETSP1338-20131121/6745_1 /TAXON_ID=43686 ORGANISM="Pelagodinium beii, Strain RCC1491" /NCGR_SAMPLE_ID=MMETSP1338 /ASSEMBLY_ACC=CAM_ASM_000754 /LENGTH=523 /DNA_ID=CAMNT_0043199411 /DNA_START=11 /DNA_END=1582 /DNA_ORIENTATION=+